ncbi:MAG: DUF3237 family protein [Panacagrimonas sp.]
MSTIEVGELLYEYTVKFTGMTEYGVSLEPLMAGKVAPPPEGARFDVAFEGASRGPKLKGQVTGVDYLRIRADRRIELHIHAAITTVDGQKIALHADGVALPREGSNIADLRENVTLSTSSKDYTWVNALQVWAIGIVDLADQVVQLKGYSA